MDKIVIFGQETKTEAGKSRPMALIQYGNVKFPAASQIIKAIWI